MKKLLQAVLILAIAFVGAQSVFAQGQADISDQGKDIVEVDIFQFKVEFKDQFTALAEEYMEETEGVKLTIKTVGGGDDYGAALRSRFASGEEPAIFNVGGPQDVADWKDYLAPLNGLEVTEKAFSGVLSGVTMDGNVYGLPYNQEGYGLIYNKEIFNKAGIDPASITSYAALEKAVKKLDSMKDSLGIKAPIAFPVKETWVTGLHLSNAVLSQEFDNVNDAFNSDTVAFRYSEGLKKLVDLQNNYSVQPTLSLDYSQQVEQLFASGKVAIIQQGNWAYGSVAGVDEELAQNIGIVPLSVYKGVGDSIPVGVPMYWGVNKDLDEAVVEEAKKFLNWMYTSETGKRYVLEEFKFIPAYEGYDVSKISDPLARDILDFSSRGKTLPWVFMGYPTGWGMNVLGIDIQKYAAGNITWEELIQHSTEEWEDARK
ncbi:MAG: ABC transporter substrate-binding protein [Spirochaetales bacterium]|nr:ABC transporter substrate-binding protein [Spirochaetales bacterium]